MGLTISSRHKAAAALLAVFALAAGPSRSLTEAANGGHHGIDLAGMDRSVKPGDDFYRFANGAWLAKTDIPSDRGRWGVFDILGEASLNRTRQLLERTWRDSRRRTMRGPLHVPAGRRRTGTGSPASSSSS